MIPYESIALAEISKIAVGDDTVDIFRHGRKPRKLNARILDQPRAFFFDEVAAQMASRQLVQEK